MTDGSGAAQGTGWGLGRISSIRITAGPRRALR